jgi:hypothetical protein
MCDNEKRSKYEEALRSAGFKESIIGGTLVYTKTPPSGKIEESKKEKATVVDTSK